MYIMSERYYKSRTKTNTSIKYNISGAIVYNNHVGLYYLTSGTRDVYFLVYFILMADALDHDSCTHALI